jgi:hypothetical protein
MNRWIWFLLLTATLAAAGCGHSGSNDNGPAPVAQDASIALAQKMIDTDTTETSEKWGEDRTGSTAASTPEEGATVDI